MSATVEPVNVSLLGDVRDAADVFHEIREREAAARETLYAMIRRAHEEGIPAARIAREARISRERVGQIVKAGKQ